ncbi:beta-xylosidase/alpha-L-arabinofuranosidase 1-like [Vitis riparia]|uniref:beta-xylosidase/alpha-L-arabinofuranosidase 1-like n=1 Tax=Vitis riparia TaxID=96939 RepID=UPI00155B05BC|nr:beta-xylosidase/alpha-L-arabinofuranosidase 1-like [Vitis riparia]
MLSVASWAVSTQQSRLLMDDFVGEYGDLAKNYTHVCDESRYALLGLDMKSFAFCDKSLSYEERAKDLVSRMTLQEKVMQSVHTASGVRRLGLPEYSWWSEALHGISNLGPGVFFDETIPGATSFPTVILSTAAFNQTLWKTLGRVISTEGRAMYNLGHAGLTFWSPNINVVRDTRWGRTQETSGEDPFVVGEFAVNFVRGLQDVEGTENVTDLNSRPLKVSSCCKHYAAYDIDSWLTVDRHTFDARVSEQDMKETFVSPFERCVREGDVSSVMCSFNKINGIPPCSDPRLLKGVIRDEWDLHGYIVSDCYGLEVIVDNQNYLNDSKVDAVAKTLQAGLDLECGHYYTDALNESVLTGKVSQYELDRALKNIYVLLMRVGYFDGIPAYESLGLKDICAADHIELAREAARQGIVLLKNDYEVLPLKPGKKIALVGPHANATEVMIGNYAGLPCKYVSPLEAFSAIGNVKYAMGCLDASCSNDTYFSEAKEAAKYAEVTIIFVGTDLSIEAEFVDRVDFLLPGNQTELIKQVAEVSSGPVILVVLSGSNIDITFAKTNPRISAILWVGFPGEQGGHAIADVVFGKYNPGGRLPVTWYEADYVDMLPMSSMSLRPVDELGYPGRTYKFFDGSTVYPFGYGMSYTKFSYSLATSKISIDIDLNKFQKCRTVAYTEDQKVPSCPAVLLDDMSCDDTIEFEVAVTNVGKVDGSEVLMVYSIPPSGIVGTHIKQVIGFQKVFVAAGDTERVKFSMNACKSLRIVDNTGYSLLPSGSHTIRVGDYSNSASYSLQVNYNYN